MKKILLIITIALSVFSVAHASIYFFELSNIGPDNLDPTTRLSLLDADSLSTKIITGGGGRLYLSTDSGSSWAETQPAGNVDKNWKSVSMSSDGAIILAGVYGGRLYLSTDSGSSWAETQPAGNVDKDWGTVSVGDSGGGILAGVYGGRLYLSTDSGSSWAETQPAGNVDKDWGTVSAPLDVGPANLLLAGVSGGRLYFSTDTGSSWAETQPAGNVDKDWLTSTIQYDGDRVIVGANGDHIYATSGSFRGWQQIDSDSNTEKEWSAVIINSDDNTYPLLAVNNTTNLFAGIPGTPDAPVVTLVSNSGTSAEINGNQISHADEVQKSSSSIFSRAHGTLTLNDKFYIGTISSPAKIVVFNDPNDLSNYDSISDNSANSFATMVYDSVNDRIYVSAQKNSGRLTIYSVNPHDIHDYQSVFASPNILSSSAPALATDGIYLYGATYETSSTLFKIRIADWTVVATNDWTGGATYGHSAVLHQYEDRTEIYMTSTFGDSALIKVNGSDLSYVEIKPSANFITDDMVFRYIDETGGIAYMGSESENKVYAIDTRTMTATQFFIPKTYGLFATTTDLYSVGVDGYIVRFPNFDLNHPRIFKFFNEIPNEFFITSDGRTFFTNWSADNAYLKEYSETENSQVMTAVLTWTEEILGVYYDLEVSLDGVSYIPVGQYLTYYGTSATLSELIPETQYWIRITASNGGIRSSSPTVYSFTTPRLGSGTSRRSSGTTVRSRYSNLISMGKQKEANNLLEQFPDISKKVKFVFTKNLTYSILDTDVKELQKFLNKNGYLVASSGAGSPGNETTKFGLLTKKALIRFQKANNIFPVSGYFGPITRSMVNR